nr:unnamed protein product [Digitaria exilis]
MRAHRNQLSLAMFFVLTSRRLTMRPLSTLSSSLSASRDSSGL